MNKDELPISRIEDIEEKIEMKEENTNRHLLRLIKTIDLEGVKELLAKGEANLEEISPCGTFTPLIFATRLGAIDIIKELLSKGALPNNINIKDATALMWAAYLGYTEIVELLISNGANINQQNIYNDSAIVFAAKGGRYEVMEFLLKEHILSLKMNDLARAAFWADYYSYNNIILLLENKINILNILKQLKF
jgi:ankyrin repeat protein